MNSSEAKEQTSGDPFAGDIFADPRREDSPLEESAAQTADETPRWSRNLPKAAPAPTDWARLRRNLPAELADELPNALEASLSSLFDSAEHSLGEFLLVNEREINRPADAPIINPDSWWLTAAIENSSAEIHLQIGNIFAGWLVDAMLEEKPAAEARIRDLTASEAAVLEYAALQLIYDANRLLQAPLFVFRSLQQRIPSALKKLFEAQSVAMLVADWQIAYGRQTSLTKLYLTPAALEALQPAENKLLESVSGRTIGAHYRTQVENLRMRVELGSTELTLAELATIEKNDVILLETPNFYLRSGALHGQTNVLLGDGENVALLGKFVKPDYSAQADIYDAAGQDARRLVRPLNAGFAWRLTVTEMPPALESAQLFEKPMPEENPNIAETDAENAAPEETNTALENIGINLRVELEARRLSLEEVANLRINQIIDLGASPTDPVNLLIDNKVIGRGELVEIENRLGVRVIKLMN